MADGNKVAFVTGASRGIGKGCALALARAGYDIVVCARTIKEGTPLEHSSTVRRSDTTPLPGSLETTAKEIEALGPRAVIAKLDLLEPSDAEAAIRTAIDAFGRIDVLVNNARYIGPGHMDLFLDTPMEIYEQHFQCNVLGPLRLMKLAVPHMRAQEGGVFIHVTSGAGQNESPKLPEREAGDSGTRSARRRSIASRRAWRRSSSNTASPSSTLSRASWPRSAWRKTWRVSASTRARP